MTIYEDDLCKDRKALFGHSVEASINVEYYSLVWKVMTEKYRSLIYYERKTLLADRKNTAYKTS